MDIVDDSDLVASGIVEKRFGLCGQVEMIVRKEKTCIIFVPISRGEIQAFLIERRCRWALLNKHSPWMESQIRMVEHAYDGAEVISLGEDVSFALGTWHFGHLLGDHGLTLLRHRRSIAKHKWLASPFTEDHTNLICRAINSEIRHKSIGLGVTGPAAIVELKANASVFLPAENKSFGLSALREVNRTTQFTSVKKFALEKVFLTSLRCTRIRNIEDIVRYCKQRGWLVVNPGEISWDQLSMLLHGAYELISENGSILFNTFLLRDMHYRVLASERCQVTGSHVYSDGGYVYNGFHDGIIEYIYCPCSSESHHPYSDQIIVDPSIFG